MTTWSATQTSLESCYFICKESTLLAYDHSKSLIHSENNMLPYAAWVGYCKLLTE